MKPSIYAFLLIQDFEQLQLKSYRCPAGVWTIGWGHTRGVTRNMSITRSQAEEYLRQDVSRIETELATHHLTLNQSQYDAIVSLVFNIGAVAFARSTLLRKLKANPDDPSIADEFRRWIYCKGQVLDGLKRRREQEIKLYYS